MPSALTRPAVDRQPPPRQVMLAAVVRLCVGALLLFPPLAEAGDNVEHLHDRFIVEGRDEDYLILENVDSDTDSVEMAEEPLPVYVGQDKDYHAEDDYGSEEDEADLLGHSLWTTEGDADSDALRPYGHSERCPLPAPSSTVAAFQACEAPECEADADCLTELLCCHNGCVRTCTTPMQPSVEIDWVNRRPPAVVSTKSASTQHVALSSHLVTMAGGCVLTFKQFKELAGFRKNENINRCFCDKGGVFCEVARNFPAEN